MHFETARQAMDAIKGAGMGKDLITTHDYQYKGDDTHAAGTGWLVLQHGFKPITGSQRDRLTTWLKAKRAKTDVDHPAP